MTFWGKEKIYKYQQQLFKFYQEVYTENKQISKDKLKDPEINIAGPTFESSFIISMKNIIKVCLKIF